MMETELEKYFDRLWPICRSITGNGLRESFEILKEIIPLQLSEIPSGTKVFDWEVPMEWNINEAYIITPNGDKICDFKINNLHVLNYSIAVNKEIERIGVFVFHIMKKRSLLERESIRCLLTQHLKMEV